MRSVFGVFVLAGCALLLAAIACLAMPGVLALVLAWSSSSGSSLSIAEAEHIVMHRRHVLDRALALSRADPRPPPHAPACRRIVDELGAIDMHFEDHGPLDEETWVVITFSRQGIAEVYEDRLVWVPMVRAQRVRAGKHRLGEDCTDLDDGWFLVWW